MSAFRRVFKRCRVVAAGLVSTVLVAIVMLGALSRTGPVSTAEAAAPCEFLCALPALSPGTIYVAWEATGANDGTSWGDAFVDLQLALEVAGEGDEIWVAAGTYYPSIEHGGVGDRYKSFQMLNGVGIYGGFDPSVGDTGWEDRDWMANETILSGDIGTPEDPEDNCYHVFYHPEGLDLDSSAVLDGFTVTGGNAVGSGEHSAGGGMHNNGSSPALVACAFEDNTAEYSGGGMYNGASSPLLDHCSFRGNSARAGGGMYNYDASPMVTGCRFSGNAAFAGFHSYGSGGGMYNWISAPVLSDCTFEGNTADGYGGGMRNYKALPVLTNCTLSDNSATYEGGGMYNANSVPVLANCAFSGNWSGLAGGGMYNFASSATLVNCTFYGNSAGEGGGMYNSYSAPVLTNCILWADSPDEIYDDASRPDVTYSDVEGGYPGLGNSDDDPELVDPDNGDFHLTEGSLCIDAGTNDAPYLPAFDFEGDDRIMDGDNDGTATVDMGVDEFPRFREYVYLPIVLRND